MTSISECGTHKDHALSYRIEATIANGRHSLGLEIPYAIDAIATNYIMGSKEVKGIGSQSSTVILKTLEAPK